MRFLADENFPGAAVTALGSAGHDVVWVGAVAAGASDPDVLAWAAREERILLTFDKDFGELAKASALPPGCGVVFAAHADAESQRCRTAARRLDNRAQGLGRPFLRH